MSFTAISFGILILYAALFGYVMHLFFKEGRPSVV